MQKSKLPLLLLAATILVLAIGLLSAHTDLQIFGKPSHQQMTRLLPTEINSATMAQGNFTLVDDQNRPVTEQNLRSRYTLLYFGFTRCPDICPTTLATLAEALNQLPPPQRAKLRVILVSVDPVHDAPAMHPGRLQAYVTSFGPPEAFSGWTGTIDQLHAAAAAYQTWFARRPGPSGQSDDYTMDHSSQVYLTDPDGHYLTRFTHATSAADISGQLARLIY